MFNRTAQANKAIAEAWQREQQLVGAGKGTRDWTLEQQLQILFLGKAFDENGKPFEGHHMKSVEEYPEYQGDPDNIQFLTREEHKAAHQDNFRNPTNGYYDPESGTTRLFEENTPIACEIISLSTPIEQENSFDLSDMHTTIINYDVISDRSGLMGRSFSSDIANPDLFSDNKPGNYEFISNSIGKSAFGQLTLSGAPRDAVAQRNAGGEARRGSESPYGKDDGGHLIGARFGGLSIEENLTAMDSNLNRQDYKNLENTWAELLSDTEHNTKVFVNIETFDAGNTGRPTNIQGYYIVEQTDAQGNTLRTAETFSFNNESRGQNDSFQVDDHDYGWSNDTTAQYHWDEERGVLVPNPDYNEAAKVENGQLEENDYSVANSAEPEMVENSYGIQDENAFQPESSEYGAPIGETISVDDIGGNQPDMSQATGTGNAQGNADGGQSGGEGAGVGNDY